MDVQNTAEKALGGPSERLGNTCQDCTGYGRGDRAKHLPVLELA